MPVQIQTLPEGAPTPDRHVLHLWPLAASLPRGLDTALARAARATLARRRLQAGALERTPLTLTATDGTLHVLCGVPLAQGAFEQHTALALALAPLLAEQPAALTVRLHGDEAAREALGGLAAYAALANGQPLSTRRAQAPVALQHLRLCGAVAGPALRRAAAAAGGNWLARELTQQPPDALTPALYRRRIGVLARQHGWEVKTYGVAQLRRLGAGAFLAVAQGSPRADAAIVRLRYRPRRARAGGAVALVGKGICFDTGGHNLKPARSMLGMHEDMNGSAVVLGILAAASQMQLPVALTGWLALAENHIGPEAYRQNEVVRALDGTTIEVVHTDAEGRMVLADTLALAARDKPAAIVDFATLTGSMVVALGNRYSGLFGNRAALTALAVEAGRRSGERLCAFPPDADYDAALESKVADVRQCTLEGEADHILGARLLQRFVAQRPWLHVDLSASSCKGGLGAILGDLTGFGVAWALELLADPALGPLLRQVR